MPAVAPSLILWEDPRERQFLARTLAAAGAEVCPEASLDALDGREIRLVLVDWDSAPIVKRARELLAHLTERQRRPITLLVSDNTRRDALLGIFSDDAFTNLIAKSSMFMAHELAITVMKLLRNDMFGLEKYFGWGVSQHAARVTSSDQRSALLDGLESYLRGIGCNQRLISLGRGVGEEFLMNAIYDAPVDEEGAQKYAAWPRSRRVVLAPSEEIVFRYASDGQILALSVADNFGRLTRETVLEYLRKCLEMGPNQIDTKEGGAGLGLYHVFESINSLVVNIEANRRTEMIGLLDISGSYRDFAARSKSLHFFFQQE